MQTLDRNPSAYGGPIEGLHGCTFAHSSQPRNERAIFCCTVGCVKHSRECISVSNEKAGRFLPARTIVYCNQFYQTPQLFRKNDHRLRRSSEKNPKSPKKTPAIADIHNGMDTDPTMTVNPRTNRMKCIAAIAKKTPATNRR